MLEPDVVLKCQHVQDKGEDEKIIEKMIVFPVNDSYILIRVSSRKIHTFKDISICTSKIYDTIMEQPSPVFSISLNHMF